MTSFLKRRDGSKSNKNKLRAKGLIRPFLEFFKKQSMESKYEILTHRIIARLHLFS